MTKPIDLLPHRWPLLLLDRVSHVRPGENLRGYLRIKPDDPWYADEFPCYLVLESWLQAAGVLARWGGADPDAALLVGRLHDIRLIRPAFAGETVVHRVDIVKAAAGAAICAGVSTVAGEPILEIGQVVVSLRGGAR
ncbi:3-hydroxyacyl-ACP dehydratase FabZ family protein [Nocardia suismassiliense]|uniref:3-hydroxyacyl-ACP dehydratase FabZ family protein n=1 Tax=Nocardia suismassiliense TaxID=2077092 RepID=UPI000D1EB5B3|nr:3-hydroxyacyl-ACP dehydratase [Nocardia suismassiliense]